MPQTLYDTDFYAWAQAQATALQQAQFDQLDIANLIEEIEDIGKSQRRQLESRLAVLIGQLLKWQFQPNQRSRSWEATIRTQRVNCKNCFSKTLAYVRSYPRLSTMPIWMPRIWPGRKPAWTKVSFPALALIALVNCLPRAFSLAPRKIDNGKLIRVKYYSVTLILATNYTK